MLPITTRWYVDNVTPEQEIPPPIKQNNDRLFLNFNVTILEDLFITFVRGGIQACLDKKNNLICLEISEKEQSAFNAYFNARARTVNTFTHQQFSTEQLSLNTIVPSIWTKAKNLIDNCLAIESDSKIIENENYWQRAADNMTAQLHLQGTSWKIFTARQARLLLEASK
jgi:hypothetical protein